MLCSTEFDEIKRIIDVNKTLIDEAHRTADIMKHKRDQIDLDMDVMDKHIQLEIENLSMLSERVSKRGRRV